MIMMIILDIITRMHEILGTCYAFTRALYRDTKYTRQLRSLYSSGRVNFISKSLRLRASSTIPCLGCLWLNILAPEVAADFTIRRARLRTIAMSGEGVLRNLKYFKPSNGHRAL